MIPDFRKFFCLLFLIVPLLSIAQNKHRIDSLTMLLSTTTNEQVKCDVYSRLFLENIRSNMEKAVSYNEQGLKLALKIKYPKGITDARYNQSSVFGIKGQYDSALAIMLQAKPTFRELPDKADYADCLSEIGYLYALKNDLKNALVNLYEAKKIYESTSRKSNLPLLYNRFGTLYQSQKLFDSALVYYKKSLALNDATGFKLGSSVNLSNIGNVYEDKGEHQKAIIYYNQSLEIKEKLKDKSGIIKCLNNIGMAYMNLGNVTEAIKCHEKTLALALEYKSNLDIAKGYVNLGFDYQKDKNYKRAIDYTLKGLKLAREINDLKLLREATRVLFESYGSLRNFEEAYNYHLQFKKFSDSIVNETNLKALAEIQAKYHVATKENEISQLKVEKNSQELQIQKLRAWYFLALGLFIGLIALAFFFYYRSRTSRKLSLKINEISEMKSHFFANLSHEFRTPLTLMLGPVEKLLETAIPKDKLLLELVHRNASRLLYLDEQLLEFTRIDSGSQKIHLVSGNVLLPVKAIAESYIHLAEKMGIRFAAVYPDDPVEIFFDIDILEKIIGNLLSNAFKYTHAGGTINLELTTGKFGHRQNSDDTGKPEIINCVRINVRDDGIGIAENKKELIFERFYQLNYNNENRAGGVGIGLALTRELLQLHHGFITLESAEGSGSLFSVFLPMDRNSYSEEERSGIMSFNMPLRKDVPDSGYEDTGQGGMSFPDEPFDASKEEGIPQILVVDDNADMRMYIRELLHEFYTVSDTADSIAGFEVACNTIPDLIITDIMMYPESGIEFCRKLKIDERTSHIPVIMLTALSDSREKVAGLETGADDYITKPFSTHELLARIKNLVAQRIALRKLFSANGALEPALISVTSADQRFLEKLIQIVEKNIGDPELDVEFLLNNVAMSRSQLHRKIKAVSGQPITGFIRIIRIKRAAQLMEQKFGNVSEIMYAVGFNNQSYFTKSFREVYGMTPSEFMAK